MKKFGDYRGEASTWVTAIDTEFYPDLLDNARIKYDGVVGRFSELADVSESSAALLRLIMAERDEPPANLRRQLLRVFRKYVSPVTPVELLKRRVDTEATIQNYGSKFREVEEVRAKLAQRADPDDALLALLYEHGNRGTKGYDLTDTFFTWFEAKFAGEFTIEGPRRAGRDVILSDVLPEYSARTPADFVIRNSSDVIIAVGFARYDSDRGGSQEDDRTGGNRDKVTELQRYAKNRGQPLKVIFVNDGPGLPLGSMWDDYAELEEYGKGDVLICTLKMLDARLTSTWLTD